MLLDLFEEHRAEVEYDWRTRFHMGVSAVPSQMSYGEAWRQLHILIADPSSRIAAALSGWDYPVSREDLALRDLYDLTHQLAWQQGGGKGRKPDPYPRPWPKSTKTTTKPAANLTQGEIIAALRMAGHTVKLPGEVTKPAGRLRDARGRFVKVRD